VEAKKDGHIHAFHEVVYPPPLWRRVAFIVLHLVLGFVFGVLVMLLVYKVVPRQTSPVYVLLLTASMPGIIHPKTRLWGFGLLIALILLMPLALFASL
jgi:hypothetical protein